MTPEQHALITTIVAGARDGTKREKVLAFEEIRRVLDGHGWNLTAKENAQLADVNEQLMGEHGLHWCICADPENCQTAVAGYVCRAGKILGR